MKGWHTLRLVSPKWDNISIFVQNTIGRTIVKSSLRANISPRTSISPRARSLFPTIKGFHRSR
jgi:hypothetical protein